jgi:hypothetical protein
MDPAAMFLSPPPRGPQASVAATLEAINAAWLQRRVDDLVDLLDENIVMAAPGFVARAEGRDAIVEGFREFVDTARVVDFRQGEPHVDAVGGTAVATYTFEMVYERGGERFRSAGRDFWIFARGEGGWRAVWRTMFDLTDEALGLGTRD